MKKFSNSKSRMILILVLILLMLITLTCTGVSIINTKRKGEIDAELETAKGYNQVSEADFRTNNECVDFGAFFLRDLDGDGYADRILGTSKEIGKTDTLYFNISVSSEGYIKDGLIQIDGRNFTLATAIVKDSIIKENVIGNDTKQIKLNNIYAGSTKLLIGTINSKIAKVEDYSQISKVTFTATYVDEKRRRNTNITGD